MVHCSGNLKFQTSIGIAAVLGNDVHCNQPFLSQMLTAYF